MRAEASRVRRGISASEMIAIVAAGAIAAFAFWSFLGTWTSDGMTELAAQVADPATLGTSFDGSSSENGGSDTAERRRGNNGVGNGEDPPPPGLPPENDGEGTAPGDPGNRGGSWK